MPWVLDEDSALKDKLQGFQVTNYAGGQQLPVEVYFRFPDTEERIRTFPHIAIDLVDIRFDPTRAHRADAPVLNFDLETATPPTGYSLVAIDYPLPWTLVYQLSAYSRNPRHDRQLTQMLYMMFPEEYGALDMSKYDGTVRRADLLSVVRRDTLDADRKRLYRQIYSIGISSEFFVGQVAYIRNIIEGFISVGNYMSQGASSSNTPDYVDHISIT